MQILCEIVLLSGSKRNTLIESSLEEAIPWTTILRRLKRAYNLRANT
jgi:hypothetical protein